jgi:Fe-Mn family superoxide dismutase
MLSAIRASSGRGLINARQTLAKASCQQQQRTKHTLPDLPYDYAALEPVISGEIMQFHHAKHHATYVANLNVAEEKLAEAQAKNDIGAIVQLAPALKFNGGGHLNHSLFWNVLTPNGTSQPEGALANAINKDFGSFDNMVKLMTNACVSRSFLKRLNKRLRS